MRLWGGGFGACRPLPPRGTSLSGELDSEASRRTPFPGEADSEASRRTPLSGKPDSAPLSQLLPVPPEDAAFREAGFGLPLLLAPG